MHASALLLLVCAQLASGPDERQIHWQRSLDDALAIAEAEGRPLFLAVNMDGESASERIPREMYRDPEFVAHTRPFVCLVSSVFRHTPRDHDDDGQRIPCPRLGEVTCGEHIALEPLLYDRFLGDDRIAPRHALIVDGEKRFDLTLLFDLERIDQELVAAAELLAPLLPSASASIDAREDYFDPRLAALRSNRDRQAVESMLTTALGMTCREALGAITELGNPGSIDALRIVFTRIGASAVDPWVAALRAHGLEREGTTIVRDRLTRLGDTPASPGLGRDASFLELLGALDDSSATRTLLLSYLVFPNASDEQRHAEGYFSDVGTEDAPASPPIRDLSPFLEDARAFAGRAAPAPRDDALPEETAIEAELAVLEVALADAPGDPQLNARMGRAMLALARHRIDSGAGAGIELLLEDARRELGAAAQAHPDDVELLFDLARASYYLSDFEEQERLAQRAAALLPGPIHAAGDAADASARDRAEALRWWGDAAGRLLMQRADGDPAAELRGLADGGRALMEIAASPQALPDDWINLASFFAALGRLREEAAFALAGLERYPDDGGLHQTLHRSLVNSAGPGVASIEAERLTVTHPDSAVCQWYAGYAAIDLADWLRRGELPDDAIASYTRAAEHFRRAAELEEAFVDSVQYYVALAAMGRGFAHLLADRRQEAADALVEAWSTQTAIVGVRDGLDREAVDLLDGILEWRASGETPVKMYVLLDRLELNHKGNDFWARAIADSELREALRAEGRGDSLAFDERMVLSLQAARRALALSKTEANRLLLAQSATVMAESMLARNELARARSLLRVAAPLMDKRAPVVIELHLLTELAAELRAELGDPRPIDRPGR